MTNKPNKDQNAFIRLTNSLMFILLMSVLCYTSFFVVSVIYHGEEVTHNLQKIVDIITSVIQSIF